MSRHTVVRALVAAAILASASPPEVNGQPARAQGEWMLYERARAWLGRERVELAREALARLFRVSPDHPDGLVLLVEVDLREGRFDEAWRTLERLSAASPVNANVPRLRKLLHLHTEGSAKLRAARLLARAGRTSEAVAALRELYHPGGPPSGDLALEFWQLVATTPNGWPQARAGFVELVREHPENQRYRLARADHELLRKPLDVPTLRTIINLTAVPALGRQAQSAWRNTIMRMDMEAASIPFLREYAVQFPGDAGVHDRLSAVTRHVEAVARLQADPAHAAGRKGLEQLDRGELEDAERRLHQALATYPDDPKTTGGMGILRLRQGRYLEALEHFERARRVDRDNPSKWTGLARTARFWGAVAQSREALRAGDLPGAWQAASELYRLDPKHPEALLAVARVYRARGGAAEAEALLRQALRLSPDHRGAARAWVELLAERNDRAALERLASSMDARQRSVLGPAIDGELVRILRQEAERLLLAGNDDEAARLLDRAITIDGNSPWLHYERAKIHVQHGAIDAGLALLADSPAARANDPEALHALALLQSRTGSQSAALTTLERISAEERGPSIVRLQRSLWVDVQARRALELSRREQAAAARQLLTRAENVVEADLDLTVAVAAAWAQAGEHAEARRLAQSLQPVTRLAISSRVALAWLLWRIDAHELLDQVLAQVEAADNLQPQERAQAEQLRELLELGRADALISANQFASALAKLQPYSARDSQRALRAEARALAGSKRFADAGDRLRRLLALDPQDTNAAVGLIDLLITSGRQAEARDLIDEHLGRLPATDGSTVEQRVRLANALAQIADTRRAREQLVHSLALAPGHTEALATLGRLDLAEGRLDAALENLRGAGASDFRARQATAGPASLSRLAPAADSDVPSVRQVAQVEPAPVELVRAEADRQRGVESVAELLDQRTPWIGAAADWRFRRGTAGTSTLDRREAVLEGIRPVANGARVVARADVVTLDAGAIDLGNERRAREFGSILLCQPVCASGNASQSAEGLALNAGYETERLKLDLGTTPLGFAVQRPTGGLRYKSDLGFASATIEASSRPVTGSLLSYAGTRDPRTGVVWGGVQATGLRLLLVRDGGGAVGAWSSFGAHRLTGKNVLANDRHQLMGGIYWRALNEADRQLSVGLNGVLWSTRANAGEFTFGHGGYYSPRTYRSISLPLTYNERHVRWSYSVRAAASYSRTSIGEAPYYPTDPSLQSAAEARAASSGFDPHYEATTGGGFGYSLAAAVEYQWLPQMFVGGRLEIERSRNFEPNRALIYARYAFGGAAARPVTLPPTAVVPTSEY